MKKIVSVLIMFVFCLPVVVFSMFGEETFADLSFMAGARAYVMKRESPSTLIRAIREVLKATG